ncbi:hypothetical protein [Adhaeribacter aquaticus]|uniref:hypothetical protein n=1 Tax=Adhaeribacter aquaticus TaxID=299567 RepID=UPI00047B918D|nr:hypothetical protein [Adhaeribacter aquaticus]
MRNTIFALLTLLKVLTILNGIGIVFWFIFKELVKQEQDWKTKNLKYFFWTVGIVIVLSLVDFFIIYLVAPE